MIEATIAVAVIAFVLGYVLGRSNGQRHVDRSRIQLIQLAGKAGKLQDVRETAHYAAKGLRDGNWHHDAFVRQLETARGIDRQAKKESGTRPQK